MQNDGITYADPMILSEEKVVDLQNKEIWVPGSGLCLNLKDLDKIPAFYNPPKARGEDTFFSTMLTDAKVYQIPAYHFHDGFLKYTRIMDQDYPTGLRKIKVEDRQIEKRFVNASIGWIKYKPLLLYITHKEEYKERINQIKEKLIQSIPKVEECLKEDGIQCLLTELEEYNQNVEKHYNEYLRVNEIWNMIKKQYKNKL